MVGLDGAGSTTVLYRLNQHKMVQTVPTLGVNQEVVRVDGVQMEVYEIGGSEKVRSIWRTYSKLAEAVVFVIDATDEGRMHIAKEEIRRLFYGDKNVKSLIVPDIPLLVLLNKQDLPNCCKQVDVERLLDLKSLPVRSYKIMPCSAATGRNLEDGFSWLADQLRSEPLR